MSIRIRRATPADLDVLIRYNSALAWETEQKQLNADILRQGVLAVLHDPHKGFYTVAEHQGEVVGQTLVTFEWSDWRNGWYWWLQSVYVREDARRMGVFRSLFEQIRSMAIADPSVIGIRLYVEYDNQRAQQTYQTLGLDKEPYHLLGQYPLPGRENSIL